MSLNPAASTALWLSWAQWKEQAAASGQGQFWGTKQQPACTRESYPEDDGVWLRIGRDCFLTGYKEEIIPLSVFKLWWDFPVKI